ncbi:hypothetical protein CTI14_64960, partial [Methylobacterium radiotolerans]
LSKFPNLGRMQNIWVQADAPYRMQLSDVLKLNAATRRAAWCRLSDVPSRANGCRAYLSKFPNLGRMQNIWVQADAPYRMQLSDVLKLNA